MIWTAGELELHASELVRWTKCEKQIHRHTFFPGPVSEYREHIAGWVGSATHALVAEVEPPPPPKGIVFDRITPTWKAAQWQANEMAGAIRATLINWVTLDNVNSEVYLGRYNVSMPMNMYLTGTCDLRIDTFGTLPGRAADGPSIIDIKTGQDFSPAWLQLGAYKILNDFHPDNEPIKHLGVIHCPRPNYGMLIDRKATSWWHPNPDECVKEAMRVINRIGELVSDETDPIASPGKKCKYCDVDDCAARQNTPDFYTT